MKPFIILKLWIVLAISSLQAQNIKPLPFSTNFDTQDTTGWTSYALSGTNDWELGLVVKWLPAISSSVAWSNNRTSSSMARASDRALETPTFDFSNTNITYVLSFLSGISSLSARFFVEYTADNGVTWTNLNIAGEEKLNWYANDGFRNVELDSRKQMSHSLNFLKGKPRAKFRFRVISEDKPTGGGWIIDDFKVNSTQPNFSAFSGGINEYTHRISQSFKSIPLAYQFLLESPLPVQVVNKSSFYLSKDKILDASDTFLYRDSFLVKDFNTNRTIDIPLKSTLQIGSYFVLFNLDSDNSVAETNETDNSYQLPLEVEPAFFPPYVEDFEKTTIKWTTNATKRFSEFYPSQWRQGYSQTPHIEGGHAGIQAWFMETPAVITNEDISHFIASPYVKLDSTNNSMCFWYKQKNTMYGKPNEIVLKLKAAASNGNIDFKYAFFNIKNVSIPETRRYDWDCHCEDLKEFDGFQHARYQFEASKTFSSTDLVVVDDIYFGAKRPDLSLEYKQDLATFADRPTDSLNYTLFNGGALAATPSVSKFYWSKDTTLDNTDVLLATISENSLPSVGFMDKKLGFTKPVTDTGIFYILYNLDASNTNVEMRETNNKGFFTVRQMKRLKPPYNQNFELNTEGWYSEATIGNNQWQWATTQKPYINRYVSDGKAWVTQATSTPESKTRSHLYTPIFDMRLMKRPVLEFDLVQDNVSAQNTEQPQVNMHYSLDGGQTWQILVPNNDSYKGFYDFYTYRDGKDTPLEAFFAAKVDAFFQPLEKPFSNTNVYRGRDSYKNAHFVFDLNPFQKDSSIQFRFNYWSPKDMKTEGVLIDNFKITEGFIDLAIANSPVLMPSSQSSLLKFETYIDNTGNFYTKDSFSIAFYLSKNATFEASDVLLVTERIPSLQPQKLYYLNEVLGLKNNKLTDFSYLVYKIDSENTITESNELNNIGAWRIAVDSLNKYPYTEKFDNPDAKGWINYAFAPNDTVNNLKNSYRWRNRTFEGEFSSLSRQNYSGFMFADKHNSGNYNAPFQYLETPTFDLSRYDSVTTNFDLVCTGITDFGAESTGGNMQFSTNGGNSWVLVEADVTAKNWYNAQSPIFTLNGQTGWTGRVTQPQPLKFTYRSNNLTPLLRGQKANLRFQYRSTNYPDGTDSLQGIKLDNFTLSAFTVDYVARDRGTLATLKNPASGEQQISLKIGNEGQVEGRVSEVQVYWSKDTIWDAQDSLMGKIVAPIILKGFEDVLTFKYKLPASAKIGDKFYIIYKADAKNQIVEWLENNNEGYLTLNIVSKTKDLPLDNIQLWASKEGVHLEKTDMGGQDYDLTISNTLGQIISQQKITSPQYFGTFFNLGIKNAGVFIVSVRNRQTQGIKTLTFVVP
jgi:hypothetical protein